MEKEVKVPCQVTPVYRPFRKMTKYFGKEKLIGLERTEQGTVNIILIKGTAERLNKEKFKLLQDMLQNAGGLLTNLGKAIVYAERSEPYLNNITYDALVEAYDVAGIELWDKAKKLATELAREVEHEL